MYGLDINFDYNTTQEYKFRYESQCDCAYCRNYYKTFKVKYIKTSKLLEDFGLYVDFPLEAMPLEYDKINKEIESKKKGLLKGDVSASEHKILELSDVLNAQPESPLLVLVKDALDKPSAPTELYLRPNGEVYQKVI